MGVVCSRKLTYLDSTWCEVHIELKLIECCLNPNWKYLLKMCVTQIDTDLVNREMW